MQQFARTLIYRNLDIQQDLPALVSMLKDVEQTDQVGEDVSEAALFVRKHGFEPISTYTRLRVPAGQTFPGPVLPDGFTIRSYDQLKRVDLYTEASNRGYEGQWGHLHVTEEEVAAFLSRLNSAGIFLLFAPDGSAAGTCRANFNTEDTTCTALIDAPGVAPEYRAAGLAFPLLLAAIHWLLPQQPAMLELEAWGETPENLALYRELGFQTVREEISYRREVRDEE